MKAVKAMQDDSGHWYLIPNELVNRFDMMVQYDSDNIDYDLQEQFILEFSQYMTGGDINNVQLYINV